MIKNTIALVPSIQLELDLCRALRRIKTLEEEVMRLQALVAPGKSCIRAVQGTQVFRISLLDILYFRAESNYTRIVLKTGKAILTSRTLKSWAEEVGPLGFLRCHKSYLVRADEIKAINKKEQCLMLQSGEFLPVSRGCRKAVFDPSMWGCKELSERAFPKPGYTVRKLTKTADLPAYTFGS
ncbi:MAG: LytTR family transcriptional regulator [Saprospiraceae bacterium]|nr:LytTR family transcriptional regulator [Candidatus Opimibacter iunctus]